ncbi:MFS transporter [Shimwellia blattae]|uniref:Inner membrane protein with sugar phosphate permease domain n=1 Tax=Shimwellia blattae (strain ATCC 29907 / DSM 4481 / JCM 1650 / NBRC 105725 / CDC 9005-74) TaxID=630626 RepID=I2B927_SHIBC|nr:MFS transporter [Shimwellia blattae]AFJ47031.1 inner membrane protein with sugar phosphate permease domain [Shimwellia blattae DSM 4481 = NBRC 105725]GAB80846.1 putative major facilitator superfamily transporter YihN [Shimwellia blattae DSM 4481 = NBRC 105725]VDY64525.1 Inner membrane protein yihN [Shimwellia blattae]VEC22633.1 Inner membrane protein yihN [Shimwellia blattae]
MLTKKKWTLFSLLILCGGTIYKLPSLKDAFYIPMQEYFHLTNGQIGNAMSVNSIVTTIGFFLSVYFSDKLPRRFTMSFSLVATGLLGLYLSTMPGYWGILFVWALFGVTCDMLNWPVLLKSVSLLGDSTQQGRLFGFFETGRGIVDTIVAFSALAIFAALGGTLLGFRGGILFYSITAIVVGIVIFFVMKSAEHSDTPARIASAPASDSQNNKMGSVLKNKTVWLVACSVFCVYSVYCGLTFFIPFLSNIYALPVALVGAYGIINQYGLKMIGGPVGGMIADKVLKSPSRYLFLTFIISAIMLGVLIVLPHENMSVYMGMLCTLSFGAVIFTQRAVFFAPIGESGIEASQTGSAMAMSSFIGYAPAMFCFSLYGHILDKFPGMAGYQIVFGLMACFACAGIIISGILVSRIRKNNNARVN